MRYMTTQELMDLYGVSWFKMDELAGNSLIDSKGNAVATFTGTPTVVEGFGSQGRAKSFNNPAQWIRFNTKVLPLGEKSIRFKIKTRANNYECILGNADFNSPENGDYVQVRPGGYLNWYSFKGSGARFVSTSTIPVNDNSWHDILLTWDGTTNTDGVKMYIDDMYTPHKTTTANLTETSVQSRNFSIAINPYSNTNAITATLDEIEIYNEAITLVPPPVNKILLSSNNKTYSLTPPIYATETAVPEMTSNTTPSGRAFSSSTYDSNNIAWRAFDRIINQGHVGSGSIGHLGYEFFNPIKIGKYSLNSSGSGVIQALPKNWTFQGSNDGINWSILDRQVNQTWATANAVKEYIIDINKVSSYKMYRLNWTSNDGYSYYTNIAELRMFELIPLSKLITFPNYLEQTFINNGMDSSIPITQLDGIKSIESTSTAHESGKKFTHAIDLSKRRVDKIILSQIKN